MGRRTTVCSPASVGTPELRADRDLPQLEHPGVDMLQRQSRAIHNGEVQLPYPGLPRDWITHAINLVLRFDPDKIYLFGSTERGEDTRRSDIDLLVAFDGLPEEAWDRWERKIRYAARFFCPYPVNVFVTDVEDLVRMRHVVVSPCRWAQEEGRLVFDKQESGS